MVMPSMSTNGSPSMTIRSEKVPESPSSALQTMYFCAPGAPSTVFHLMPAGNAAPPRPRRPEAVTRSTICAGVEGERGLEAAIAIVGEIVIQRRGVGDAHACEGQSLLAREIGNVLGRSVSKWVLGGPPAGRLERLQEACSIVRLHGSVRMAPARHLELDHRLEPQQAPRAVADQLYFEPPARRFRRNGVRRCIGAHGASCRVVGYVNLEPAHRASARSDCISSSKRSGETRPCNCSSIMRAGPKAQLPRQ